MTSPAPPDTGTPVSADYRARRDAWIEQNPIRTWRAGHTPPLTQVEAAPLLGVGSGMLQLWEQGVHNPRPSRFARLAEHLGPDIADRWRSWSDQRPTAASR